MKGLSLDLRGRLARSSSLGYGRNPRAERLVACWGRSLWKRGFIGKAAETRQILLSDKQFLTEIMCMHVLITWFMLMSAATGGSQAVRCATLQIICWLNFVLYNNSSRKLISFPQVNHLVFQGLAVHVCKVWALSSFALAPGGYPTMWVHILFS